MPKIVGKSIAKKFACSMIFFGLGMYLKFLGVHFVAIFKCTYETIVRKRLYL